MRFSAKSARVARVISFAATLIAPTLLSAQGLPDAKSLMEKHNVAIGGRAAIDKYQTMHMTATMNIAAMGMDATMEVYRSKPNKLLQKIVIGPIGEILTGYDGKTAWTTNPMQGASIIEGEAAMSLKYQADFFANLQTAESYPGAQTVEITDFEGRKCYKVKVVRDGRDGMEFFDATTGLLAGFSGTQVTQQGPVESTTVFEEYGDWGGLKLPKKIVQKGGPAGATITFTAVNFDKVDAAVFELPAAVKALVKP